MRHDDQPGDRAGDGVPFVFEKPEDQDADECDRRNGHASGQERDVYSCEGPRTEDESVERRGSSHDAFAGVEDKPVPICPVACVAERDVGVVEVDELVEPADDDGQHRDGDADAPSFLGRHESGARKIPRSECGLGMMWAATSSPALSAAAEPASTAT